MSELHALPLAAGLRLVVREHNTRSITPWGLLLEDAAADADDGPDALSAHPTRAAAIAAAMQVAVACTLALAAAERGARRAR